MYLEKLAPLAIFAVVASITPGPNNLMLMSSGTLFGIRKTLPHVFGVVFGFVSLLATAVFGVAQAIVLVPEAMMGLKIAGACWLGWLAFQFFKASMNSASMSSKVGTKSRPLSFVQAFGFQWANPKALVNAISCAGAFAAIGHSPLQNVAIMGGVFLLVGLSTSLLWAYMGHVLQRLLCGEKHAAWLNLIMALLIMLTAIMILFV